MSICAQRKTEVLVRHRGSKTHFRCSESPPVSANCLIEIKNLDPEHRLQFSFHTRSKLLLYNLKNLGFPPKHPEKRFESISQNWLPCQCQKDLHLSDQQGFMEGEWIGFLVIDRIVLFFKTVPKQKVESSFGSAFLNYLGKVWMLSWLSVKTKTLLRQPSCGF